MKKAIFLTLITALALAVPGSANAGGRSLADLRAELEALTDAITTQMKLLEIMERVKRPDEAAATRVRIRDLIVIQQKVLVELTALFGGDAPRPPEKPGQVGLPDIGRLADPPENPSPNARLEAKKARGGFASRHRSVRPITALSKHIDLALEWLKQHQSPGGFWDTDGFTKQCIYEECDGVGHALYDPGVTGLATLAFLGAGETHKHGRYKSTVKKALTYLKQIQDPEGCFGPRTTNHYTYNHAAAAQAMVTAYALTASPLFKKSSQAAVDFIQKAQNPYLAWRYGVRPGDNDTSVTGWMTAALCAGKSAGLRVDTGAFDGARAWIEKVTEPEFGRVGYTMRGTGSARSRDMMEKFPADKSESLTAVGILIRMLVGENPATSEMIQKGVDLILKQSPQWNEASGQIDMYYWYWGTHALSRVGGEAWEHWSGKMSAIIATAQRTGRDVRGSYDPVGPWGREGGRVYSTAMMTMVAEMLERQK